MMPAELMRLKALDRALHLADIAETRPTAEELVGAAETIRSFLVDGKPGPERPKVVTNIHTDDIVTVVRGDGAPARAVPKPGEHLRGLR